jgi:hypothetical protein
MSRKLTDSSVRNGKDLILTSYLKTTHNLTKPKFATETTDISLQALPNLCRQHKQAHWRVWGNSSCIGRRLQLPRVLSCTSQQGATWHRNVCVIFSPRDTFGVPAIWRILLMKLRMQQLNLGVNGHCWSYRPSQRGCMWEDSDTHAIRCLWYCFLGHLFLHIASVSLLHCGDYTNFINRLKKQKYEWAQ